ncbi:MAG TPA: M35 family metallo-endopeptidase, partial [Dyella sp.]|nr:M35 family metallo-endopeptidase [Dyella sp.]
EINVCDRFFTLPQSAYGADNQVLTLIHEASHFSDSWGLKTSDIVYGRANARSLAASNHASAVINADNFAYWIEAMNLSQ